MKLKFNKFLVSFAIIFLVAAMFFPLAKFPEVAKASPVYGSEVLIDSFTSTTGSSAKSFQIIHPSDSATYFSAWGQVIQLSDAYKITEVSYQGAGHVGSPVGNLTCQIFEISGTYGTDAVPTGTMLAESEKEDMATFPNAVYVNFTFTDGFFLDAGNYAFAVIAKEGTVDVSNYAQIYRSSLANHSGNYFYYYNSAWDAGSAADFLFYLYGDEVLGYAPDYSSLDAERSQGNLTLSSYWSCGSDLDFYSIEENSTGSAINHTSAFSSNPDWANLTLTGLSTSSKTIAWTVYANSTGGFWNSTATQYYSWDCYKIDISTSAGGSASPTGTLYTQEGATEVIAFSPNTGLLVSYLTVDSVNVSGNTVYTFSNIAANHTIYAGFGDAPALSATWLTGWKYRKGVVINQLAGADVDYNVMLIAHYGSGTDNEADFYCDDLCQSDFDDIVFTTIDGTTKIDYYLENKTDSDVAYFWLQIPGNLTEIYQVVIVYYGNPAATSLSNGYDTFTYFETLDSESQNFEGSIWDKIYYDGSYFSDDNYFDMWKAATVGADKAGREGVFFSTAYKLTHAMNKQQSAISQITWELPTYRKSLIDFDFYIDDCYCTSGDDYWTVSAWVTFEFTDGTSYTVRLKDAYQAGYETHFSKYMNTSSNFRDTDDFTDLNYDLNTWLSAEIASVSYESTKTVKYVMIGVSAGQDNYYGFNSMVTAYFDNVIIRPYVSPTVYSAWTPRQTYTPTVHYFGDIDLYFRNSPYEYESESGYLLDPEYGDTATNSYVNSIASEVDSYYGIRAFLIFDSSNIAELTGGTPVAVITLDTNNTLGYETATWTLDSNVTVLFGNQALMVKVYHKFAGGSWTERENFITEPLLTSNIGATTWQFKLYVNFTQRGGSTYSSFKFDSLNYLSGVYSLWMKEPSAWEMQSWRIGENDYFGFIFGAYTDEIGVAAYLFMLLIPCGALYFRGRSLKAILFLFLMFGGAGGIVWAFVPFWAAAVVYGILLLGCSFIVWRLIR